MFQHTAARRWLQFNGKKRDIDTWFQHTATRRRLPHIAKCLLCPEYVSTHSHPKVAAVSFTHGAVVNILSFNTQPPESGCTYRLNGGKDIVVSTHSHPKVAARDKKLIRGHWVSFNTQPPESGRAQPMRHQHYPLSFNTQPPESGRVAQQAMQLAFGVSTHSHPKVAA